MLRWIFEEMIEVRVGLLGQEPNLPGRSIDEIVAEIVTADRDGFHSFWAPQTFGFDAITVLALAAREASRIELCTGVVPTQTRHPVTLAGQALTAQAAAGGRFVLGVGLSHRAFVESMLGLPFDRPVRHLKEVLATLVPLVQGETARAAGELATLDVAMSTAAQRRIPVIVGALGEQTLRVAGRMTDGTKTWMTGPKTLATHTVPTITAAAAEAGRPAPRIVVALPVCVTDDPSAVREKLATDLALYNSLPSYRAMMDREGAGGPDELAIIGDERELHDRLREIEDAGATDFAAHVVAATDSDRERTRDALRALL